MPARPLTITVIYYSATGHVADLANEMVAALREAEPSAQIRLRRAAELAPPEAIASHAEWQAHHAATASIEVATASDIVDADAVIMGSPTRFGNIAAQLKQFLDTLGPQWQAGLLADKVYSAFTSTGTLHGGAESTLLALHQTFHRFGGIVVAPGYTDPVKFEDGNPYGTSHHDAGGTARVDAVTRRAARHQALRILDVTRALNSPESLKRVS